MRILCGTILAAAIAALSVHGAVDPLAGSPEGGGNIHAAGVLTNGALAISFDDRNLVDWARAIPLFDKYGAHATFFFTGPSHGIHPDAKQIHMKTEWLERILATAKECGVAVLGFDEL